MSTQLEFQISGLVLVIMLFLFCVRKKNLSIISENVYYYLLLSVLLNICLDIASVIGLYLLPDTSLMKAALCKGYLLSLILTASILCYYVLADSRKGSDERVSKMGICVLPVSISALLLVSLELSYNRAGARLYSDGKAVVFTYIICYIYLIISAISLCLWRNKMRQSRFSALVFLVFSWMVTGLIQSIVGSILLVGYAMALSMTFVYIRMENPENYRDTTTECFNAEALNIYIAERFNKEKSISSISIAIDDYRVVVETFGKNNASQLLEYISNFLASIKGGNTFRISEYEYVLAFEETKNMHEALRVIEKRLKEPWSLFGTDVKISAGISYMVDSSRMQSAQEWIDTIHYFLRECAKLGRGCVLPINEEELLKKSEIDHAENTLRNAIEMDEVQVFFQPIYSIEQRCYSSAEALVRIRDENGKYISPELFIPIAERNGLILELGMIVFEKVCCFMKQYDVLKKGIEYIEINLSVVQCMQDDLAQELLRVMKKHAIPPNAINLEITETAAINSEKTLIQNMEELIREQVSFSLDDYGNGYSNLSYVVELPLHIVKLDKSLIWSSFENDKARIAMECAVSMIKNMGMKVLAEGVETEKQFNRLKELGIDYIQGFLFSKPVSEERFMEVIEEPIRVA